MFRWVMTDAISLLKSSICTSIYIIWYYLRASCEAMNKLFQGGLFFFLIDEVAAS